MGRGGGRVSGEGDLEETKLVTCLQWAETATGSPRLYWQGRKAEREGTRSAGAKGLAQQGHCCQGLSLCFRSIPGHSAQAPPPLCHPNLCWSEVFPPGQAYRTIQNNCSAVTGYMGNNFRGNLGVLGPRINPISFRQHTPSCSAAAGTR